MTDFLLVITSAESMGIAHALFFYDVCPAELWSVSSENIAGIHLIIYIIQGRVVAVGNDGLTLRLEGCQVIDYPTAKECGAVLEGWLIDDDLCTFRLDALHDALDGRLAEVVGIGLHGETIDTYHAGVLSLCIITLHIS